MVKNIVLTNSLKTNKEFCKLLHSFIEYAEGILMFQQPYSVVFTDDQKNAANALGKTGHYQPDKKVITVFSTERHMKDILRSLAHEMIHHKQNCDNKLSGNESTGEGYAQDNQHMRTMEKEAYSEGNMLLRDWEDELKKESTEVLKEGGVAGHMNHLYDNPDLTFQELIQILKDASEGKLVGTEKIDGKNLFISYDVNTSQTKAARNKGDIKSGGMSPEELSGKFSHMKELQKSFSNAFAAFDSVILQFDRDELIELFGPETNIWYNCEVQDANNPNVVSYDVNALVIHRFGGGEFDKNTGLKTNKDITANIEKLEQAVVRVQNTRKNTEFQVQVDAIRNLQELSDKTHLNKAIDQIDEELSKHGLDYANTTGEYIVSSLKRYIDQHIKLNPEQRKSVVMKMLGQSQERIGQVLARIPFPQSKEIVKNMISNSNLILSDMIEPLELIIHEFTVQMLKNTKSLFILDDNKEVKRLRKEVEKAIEMLEKNPHDAKFLKKQLKKLRSLDDITTAVEGFVFAYDGVLYKFTGNFAPINRILGALKYKKEPEEQEQPEEQIQEMSGAGAVAGAPAVVKRSSKKLPINEMLDTLIHRNLFMNDLR